MNALQTSTAPDHHVDAKGTVHLCAWCFPLLKDFLRVHPELSDRAFSHGVCPKHKLQVLTGALLANSKN